MEDVGLFYGHLTYFTATHMVYFIAIWYIFSCFGMFVM
jgi:hypothetical protein